MQPDGYASNEAHTEALVDQALDAAASARENERDPDEELVTEERLTYGMAEYPISARDFKTWLKTLDDEPRFKVHSASKCPISSYLKATEFSAPSDVMVYTRVDDGDGYVELVSPVNSWEDIDNAEYGRLPSWALTFVTTFDLLQTGYANAAECLRIMALRTNAGTDEGHNGHVNGTTKNHTQATGYRHGTEPKDE